MLNMRSSSALKHLPAVLLFLGWGVAAAAEPAGAADPAAAGRERLRASYFPTITFTRRPAADLAAGGVRARIANSLKAEDLAFLAQDTLPVFLYAFDGDGVLHSTEHDALVKAFIADRGNRSLLERKPSLCDREVQQALATRLGEYLKAYAPQQMLAVSICHEGSNTSFALPFDFDYAPPALQGFREWLAQRYQNDIAALNRVWGSGFRDFAEVMPPTTDELIDREYGHYPAMDLAGWFEFREFMDRSFTGLMLDLAGQVRRERPAWPVAVTVTAPPAPYGGWDYAALLGSGRIDLIETYKFPGDKGLVAGLTAGRVPSYSSHYENTPAALLERWQDFLHGERGTVIESRTLREMREAKSGVPAAAWPEAFRDFAALALALKDSRPVDGGVALVYSQPSLRSYWFVDNMPDKKTFVKRGTRYEIGANTYIQALAGWQELLGELGLQPRVESYLDWREGRFTHGRPRVLIANLLHSVSDAELALLRSYVEEGGTLVIDETFACYDDRGRPRPGEELPIAGLKRGGYAADFGKPKSQEVPTQPITSVAVKQGRVVLLGVSLARYGERPNGAERLRLRDVVAGVLESAGATASLFGWSPPRQSQAETFLYAPATGAGQGLIALCPSSPAGDVELPATAAAQRLVFTDAVSGKPVELPARAQGPRPLLLMVREKQ